MVQRVLAYDIVEQELLWSFPCEEQPGQTFYAAPSVVENDVVVGRLWDKRWRFFTRYKSQRIWTETE